MPGGTHPPLSVVASWPKPNYDNPESQGKGLIVISLLFGIVATTLVGLRLVARIGIIRQPGLDDLLIVLGLIFALLLTVSVVIADLKYGVGHHIQDVPIPNYTPLRFISFLSQFAVVFSQSCTKISILLFYRRLATGSYTKTFIWSVKIGIWYNLAYLVAFTLVIIFTCYPVSSYWEQYAHFPLPYDKKYTCAREDIALPVSGALSVLSDVYATIVPLLLLKDLKMPRKQKLLLYSLFALGFLVVAAGIARTVTLDVMMNRTYDVTWWLWTNWVWTLVEVYIAIMCASAPALKPLYVRYISPPLRSAYNYSLTRRSGNTNTAHSRSYASGNDNQRSWMTTSAKSKRGTDDWTNVEMGIVVKSEIEQQVVVVEREVPGKGGRVGGRDAKWDLGLQQEVLETERERERKANEEDSLEDGMLVHAI